MSKGKDTRLSIIEIGEFCDQLDTAGVIQACEDIAGWPHKPGDVHSRYQEAAGWAARLQAEPEQIEPARRFVRRSLEENQMYVSDGVRPVRGLRS